MMQGPAAGACSSVPRANCAEPEERITGFEPHSAGTKPHNGNADYEPHIITPGASITIGPTIGSIDSSYIGARLPQASSKPAVAPRFVSSGESFDSGSTIGARLPTASRASVSPSLPALHAHCGTMLPASTQSPYSGIPCPETIGKQFLGFAPTPLAG
jgi:hypothetical protein